MHRLRFFLFGLAILAAACGELPQPFEHRQQKAAYPLAELAVDVRVSPIVGMSPWAGRALARAVAINLGAFGFTATHWGSAPGRVVLEGRIEKATNVTPHNATLLIHWTLREQGGEETGIHVQELQATWPEWKQADAVLALGAPTAKAIAGLIGVDAELPPGAMATVRAGIFVEGVSGAPGDGNASLAAAMRRALSIRDIAVTEGEATAAHILRATVKADTPTGDQQRIAIVWRLENAGGELLGEAAQENAIEAGSLDGKWGTVAGYAAAAAVDGIEEILERSKASETGGTITLPPNSDLAPPTP